MSLDSEEINPLELDHVETNSKIYAVTENVSTIYLLIETTDIMVSLTDIESTSSEVGY